METQYKKVMDHLMAGYSITLSQMRRDFKIMSPAYVIHLVKKRNPWMSLKKETINVRGHKNVARFKMEVK